MSTVITGLFKDPAAAAQSVNSLVAAGVPESEISIVGTDSLNQESFGINTHTKLPEGAAIGAGVGGAIGALIAGFTAVGAIATGGLGLVAAGPLVAALAGAGAGAAAGSGLGALAGLAFPEHEVKHYEKAIKQGAVLIGVTHEGDSDRKALIRDTFKRFNADRISNA